MTRFNHIVTGAQILQHFLEAWSPQIKYTFWHNLAFWLQMLPDPEVTADNYTIL